MPISWFEYEATLPQGLPDVARDAQREAYFSQFVRPEVVRSGGNEASAYEEFMKATERPGKSNYPRLQSTVAHALGSVLEPWMGGSNQGKSFIRGMIESADIEAARQGVSSTLPAFAGEMLGMTPYFAGAVGQAKNLAHTIAGRTGGKEAVQAAARMQELGGTPAMMMAAGEARLAEEAARLSRVLSPAAVGTVQAAYDAGRAEPGQKLQAGWTGFGIGAGATAVLENLGPLSRLLTERHGVSPEDARLLENAAMGRVGEEEAHLVAKNLIQTPEIEQSITEWATRQFQMSKAVGNPDIADVIEKGSKLKIRMVGADGKEYTIRGKDGKGLDASELNLAVDRIHKHLQRGGKIIEVSGDTEALHKLRTGFDELFKKSGAFDLPVVPRGIVEQAPGEGLVPYQDQVSIGELLTGKTKLPEKVSPPKVLQEDHSIPQSPADNLPTAPSREVTEVTVPSTPPTERAISFSNYDTGKGSIKANFEWKGYFGEVEMPVEGEFGSILVNGQEFEVPFKTKDMAGLKFSINKVLDFVEENRPKGGKIEEAASPVDYFEKLPNGFIRDKETGQVFPSMRMALQKRGVLAGTSDPFGGSGDYEGLWIDPKGTIHEVDTSHGDFVASRLGSAAGEDYSSQVNKFFNRGWVRLRDTNLQVAPASLTPNSKPLEAAVFRAMANAKRSGDDFIGIETSNYSKYAYIAEDEIDNFLSNPRRFMDRFMKMEEARRAGTTNPFSDPSASGLTAPLGESGKGGVMLRYGRQFGTKGTPESGWVSPEGKVYDVPSGMEHAKYADRHLGGETENSLLAKSWIQVSPDGFRFQGEPSSEALSKAWESSLTYSKSMYSKLGKLYEGSQQSKMHILGPNGYVVLDVTPEAKAEFISNPLKYIARYGEKLGMNLGERTPAGEARPSNGFVRRPLYDREVRQFGPEENGVYGYTEPAYPGEKSRISYDATQLSKTPIVHETFHALAASNDVAGHLENFVRSHQMGSKLFDAFSPQMKRMYADTWGEELYTYLQQAIRLTDEDLLSKFVAADDSWEKVMNFAAETSREILGKLQEMPDSIYKRALERRVNYVLGRAGTIQELAKPIDIFGHNFYFDGDNFVVETGAKRYTFDTRDKLMRFIEENYSEPTTAASIPGEAHIPPEIRKFGSSSSPFNPSKPPGGHSPVPTDAALGKPSGGRARGGFQLFSFWGTPTYSWINTVAEKNNWPELYQVFGIELKNASAAYGEALTQKAKEILDTGVSKIPQGKRIDLAEYLRTPAQKKAEVAKALNLTSEDLQIASRLRALYDSGYKETGVNAPYLQDYVMRFENPDFDINSLRPSGRYTKEDLDFVADHTRSQELDMKNRDVLENLWTYYRLGLRRKYMGEPIKKAAQIVNMKNEAGEFALGTLQPYFKRHVELIKGNPDFTRGIVHGVMQDAISTLNTYITKANAHLPKSMQLGELQAPDDVIRKWITFSFAGTMGLRPIVPIRDSLQIFLTTYPLLGEKYLATGMAKAFPAIKSGVKSEAWEIAQRYGALMHENPMHNLASGTDTVGASKMEKVAETMLKPLLISNNSNRLVSFWGHATKAYDALVNFAEHGDPKKFMKESSGWALDSMMQKSFVAELQKGLQPEQWADFSYRMAKELVDVSQWNYQRGAAPGLYKYTLGRLFGQYGTWPMNYWNFAKRLLTQGDPSDRVLAGTRLLLAHGAVLSTMQNAGIDAGQWVFTAPAAYSGGPLTSALLALPTSLDFESTRGSEARKELARYPTLNIPGGMQMQRLYEAIVKDDPNMFAIVMGFKPMKEGDRDEGFHALVP